MPQMPSPTLPFEGVDNAAADDKRPLLTPHLLLDCQALYHSPLDLAKPSGPSLPQTSQSNQLSEQTRATAQMSKATSSIEGLPKMLFTKNNDIAAEFEETCFVMWEKTCRDEKLSGSSNSLADRNRHAVLCRPRAVKPACVPCFRSSGMLSPMCWLAWFPAHLMLHDTSNDHQSRPAGWRNGQDKPLCKPQLHWPACLAELQGAASCWHLSEIAPRWEHRPCASRLALVHVARLIWSRYVQMLLPHASSNLAWFCDGSQDTLALTAGYR